MYKLAIAFFILLIYDLLSKFEYKTLYIDVNSIKVKGIYLARLHKKLRVIKVNDLNVYNYLFITALILIGTFIYVFKLTELLIPSMVISLMMALMPYVYIDLKVQTQSSDLSLEVSKLISSLTRWAVVREDIYYCFSKAVDQIDGHLKTYVSEFLLQIKYSGHINLAFDRIIQNTKHEMLRNLMINLQQATYCKGDLVGLLERLEEESYLIYGEHERRKSETYFDKLAIYFSIVCVLIMSIIVLYLNEKMRDFYLDTTVGHYMISIFSLLFFLGVFLATKITSFNY